MACVEMDFATGGGGGESSKVETGTFTASSSGTAIDVGFKPDYVVIYSNSFMAGSGDRFFALYDGVKFREKRTNSSNANVERNTGFTIEDDGFTYTASGSSFAIDSTYIAAKK